MTAINIVCQPRHRCLHVVSDAAIYNAHGVVLAIRSKVLRVRSWPGIVTGRGNSDDIAALATELAVRCATFDDVVSRAESLMPELVVINRITDQLELILAGWSTARQMPESYVICISDELSDGTTNKHVREAQERGCWVHLPKAFELTKLPATVAAPILQPPIIAASGFAGIDVTGSRIWSDRRSLCGSRPDRGVLCWRLGATLRAATDGVAVTAVNIVLQRDRVHIISDGAAIDAAGNLARSFSKVLIFPRLNAAIAVRGSGAAKWMLGQAVDGLAIEGGFDELRSRFVGLVYGLWEFGKNTLALSPDGDAVDFYLAGISASGQADACVVKSHGPDAWTLRPCGGVDLTPCDEPLAAQFRTMWPELSWESFEPDTHGVQVIEAQRAAAMEGTHGEFVGRSVRSVGGFAELTTITKDRITSKILKRWPDEIGKPIGAEFNG